MNAQIPFLVVSADRPLYSDEVLAMRRDTFEHQLRHRDLDFKTVQGFWEGRPEVSYIVLIPQPYDEHLVLQLARRYGQETALYVDANRHASIYTLNAEAGGPDITDSVGLGQWQEVDSVDALALPAYTKDEERYYAVR